MRSTKRRSWLEPDYPSIATAWFRPRPPSWLKFVEPQSDFNASPQILMGHRRPFPEPFPVPIGLPPFHDPVTKSSEHKTARGVERYVGRLIERLQASNDRQEFRSFQGSARFLFFGFQVNLRLRSFERKSPAKQRRREAADGLFVRCAGRPKGLRPKQVMGTGSVHGRRHSLREAGHPCVAGGAVPSNPKQIGKCDKFCYRRI
jgi:hypothetical protein